MTRLALRCVPGLLVGLLLYIGPPRIVGADDPPAGREDDETLHTAGLETDGPSLLAFFNARAHADIDPERLRLLLQQLTAASNQERSLATAEFLGLGPLAIPTLRRAANDLSEPEVARRAAHCLKWLEGPSSTSLPVSAARVLSRGKPRGSAAALLAYLPFADNPEVLQAVTAALAAVALPNGKPDPALLRGLADPLAVRRAAAGVALARSAPGEQLPDVRKLLKDSAPGVRLRTALALAEAHDEEAIPVLIELLADLPIERRKRVEDFLQSLAGEWSPTLNFAGEDEIGRKIRRDAWSIWWRNVDGASLLAAVRKRTPTDEDRATIRDLLGKLTSGDFATRESASKELFALGRRSLPQLQEATKSKDSEVARRAKHLIERIEEDPSHHLPVAALRLLALRKPPGSVGALLAYLPFAEDDNRSLEVQKSLTALAIQKGKLDGELLKALGDPQPRIRATAAEALISGAGADGRAAVRKMLADDAALVRMRVALAMAMAREREGVPVLIDLLTVLPADQVGQVEEALFQLAGDTAPEVSLGTEAADKKKCRDAWLAWWKLNAKRVDLARLTSHPTLGFTVISDIGNNRVFEVDRNGKERWSLTGLGGPCDAVVLPGNHVLISEYHPRRVTERDLKNNIVWQKGLNDNPINVQRLPNGNTFIATDSYVVEVDKTGKELYTINSMPMVHAAYRMRNGPIVCLIPGNQCVLMDTTGKTLSSFNSNHGNTNLAGLDVLSNGHILITQTHRGKVVEFDKSGKVLLELDAPGARTATGLPNGHVLVTSQSNQRVYELDRAGKTVWEHKAAGPVIRARRR
jgi:HEAT repeat protein